MKAHPGLLASAEEIKQLAELLKDQPIIAFDTEFIRETTFYPEAEILQIATEEESWLVDAQPFRKRHGTKPDTRKNYLGEEAIKPLLMVFEDRKIIKVAHAIQGDQECLFSNFGAVALNTFDTAIGASLCGYGDGVGLGNLLKSALGVSIKKGHARTNWSARPLPEQLLEYAHADVQYLIRLAKQLMEELDKLHRKEWAFELSAKWEDKSLYEPSTDEIVSKFARSGRMDKRTYAALRELIRWRERRVRELNVPRRWVADDNVLLDLAHIRPKDITHLSSFRGLNKGEIKNSGEEILEALRRAASAPDVELPKVPPPAIPTSEESQVLDVLRCYVGILAERNQIAVKHLLTTPQLLPLLRSKAKTPEELVQRGLLSEGASSLIGSEVIALLKGERALSIKGNSVDIVVLNKQ